MTSSQKLSHETAPVGTRRIGPVVVISLAVGLVAAVALSVFAFAGAEEHVITGTALIAFALGWALLAACSTRWTDQPQRWAAVPAGAFGVVGACLLVLDPGATALNDLGWVWPPALAALVVWMTVRARRQLRSRARRVLLYPVFGALLLASLGGFNETVQAAGQGSESKGSAVRGGGRLVDVGGHRLFIRCSGSGSPTVVLEGGLGASSSAWKAIAPTTSARPRTSTTRSPPSRSRFRRPSGCSAAPCSNT